jgi:hypothetical protein
MSLSAPADGMGDALLAAVAFGHTPDLAGFPRLVVGQRPQRQVPAEHRAEDPEPVGRQQRLRAGESVGQPLVSRGQQSPDGDRRDVGRVDVRAPDVGEGFPRQVALPQLGRPPQGVGHERAGPQDRPRHPGVPDRGFGAGHVPRDGVARVVVGGRAAGEQDDPRRPGLADLGEHAGHVPEAGQQEHRAHPGEGGRQALRPVDAWLGSVQSTASRYSWVRKRRTLLSS